jgi:hypothetical protein
VKQSVKFIKKGTPTTYPVKEGMGFIGRPADVDSIEVHVGDNLAVIPLQEVLACVPRAILNRRKG